jgi:catechol 2,3-dioxygenase-like lactoylglutathione lyase family enzyme
MATDFMHIGLTVLDLERSIGFYSKWFGFKKIEELRFPPEFFESSESLYHLPPGVYCDMVMIESEDQKCVLELFCFSNVKQGGAAVWNETGLHHLAFKVPDFARLCETMAAEGVEFFFAPKERQPGSDKHWVFLKDPDGVMVELWD